MSIKVISLIIIRIEYEPVIKIVSADQLRKEHIRVSAHSPGGILANLDIHIFSKIFLQAGSHLDINDVLLVDGYLVALHLRILDNSRCQQK